MLFALVANGGSIPFVIGAGLRPRWVLRGGLSQRVRGFCGAATVLNAAVFCMAMVMLYAPAPLYVDNMSISGGFFVFAALALCAIGSQSTEYYWRRSYVATVFTARETDHANAMLYQMLPAAVANQLKEGRTGVSDYFEGVSILFCDIRDFTIMCQRITPLQVVHLLNQLFSAFDILTDKHNAFKVQTIGDCYVIVVGLPYRDTKARVSGVGADDAAAGGDDDGFVPTALHVNRVPSMRRISQIALAGVHAAACVDMARSMIAEVAHVIDPSRGEAIQTRIGIHTGNIVAGVIGTKALRYDMWGTDVLAANLMEANGVPKKIVVSRVTYDWLQLQNARQFKFTPHVEVEVRGAAVARGLCY